MTHTGAEFNQRRRHGIIRSDIPARYLFAFDFISRFYTVRRRNITAGRNTDAKRSLPEAEKRFAEMVHFRIINERALACNGRTLQNIPSSRIAI